MAQRTQTRIAANDEADYQDYAPTGPGTIAGRYMRLFWHPVRRAADLEPGKPIPIKILNQDFVLFRGASGAPHVIDARCPHRGAVLHIGRVEGEQLRCFYHGWKFDGAGQCVEAPAEAPSFAAKMSIRGYRAREYLGLIFVYFGDGKPPELPRYADFEGDGVRDIICYPRPCNYFQDVENMVDPGHTPFTHAVSEFTNNGLQGLPEVSGVESVWGITQFGKRPDGGVRTSQYGMPNILNLIFQPAGEGGVGGWRNLIAWVVPTDDTCHLLLVIRYADVRGAEAERYRKFMAERDAILAQQEPNHLLAQRIVAGEIRIDDPVVTSRSDLLQIQDHVTQIGQGIFANREAEHLGRSDVLIALQRRMWSREMRAMAEGRPLKQWLRTEEVRATNGLRPV